MPWFVVGFCGIDDSALLVLLVAICFVVGLLVSCGLRFLWLFVVLICAVACFGSGGLLIRWFDFIDLFCIYVCLDLMLLYFVLAVFFVVLLLRFAFVLFGVFCCVVFGFSVGRCNAWKFGFC